MATEVKAKPRRDYRLADNIRVPGVTTVIGGQLAWSKGALMYWAWNEGREGRDFRKTSEEAANIGTIVHRAIELVLHGRPDSEAEQYITDNLSGEQIAKAENSLLAFHHWREGFGVEVTDTELAIVSEKHRVGGTIDIVARAHDKRTLVDLKTSKNVYADHRIQLATYGKLYEEVHPDDPITGGYYLLRVDKEDGGFAFYYWPSLEEEFETFLLLRQLYDKQKKLKK
jgi:hypothetical protein